jgi:hypothetical protein
MAGNRGIVADQWLSCSSRCRAATEIATAKPLIRLHNCNLLPPLPLGGDTRLMRAHNARVARTRYMYMFDCQKGVIGNSCCRSRVYLFQEALPPATRPSNISDLAVAVCCRSAYRSKSAFYINGLTVPRVAGGAAMPISQPVGE